MLKNFNSKNSGNTFLPKKTRTLKIEQNYPKISKEENNQPKIIKQVNNHIKITNLHNDIVYSIIQLVDKRIATGSYESISICSVNILTKEWNIDIYKQNSHNKSVNSLCELSENRLISCSFMTINIWLIALNDLILKKTFTTAHTDWIYKVISLTKDRFASCSIDTTVKIWESSEPYQSITTPQHGHSVYSILQLKNKEILVSSCKNKSIMFWNIDIYVKEHTLKGYFSHEPTHMVELPNSKIAVSSSTKGFPIVIIDTNDYRVIKQIKVNNYIKHSSSLCVLNNNSFVYIHEGKVLQIDSKDYKILNKLKVGNELDGYFGIISLGKEWFLGVPNYSYGISILLLN